MKIMRAYKTELDLNNQQITACKRHAGAARFAYNWGLKRKEEVYKATGRNPNSIELHRELNALKKTEFAWMREVSKCAPQEALRNLDNAFARFLRRCELKKQGKFRGKVGYPKFKTKKRAKAGFRFSEDIKVLTNSIRLPRLGWLRLKEHGYLPTSGVRILSATVSERSGHWYVSLQVEQEQDVHANTGPVIGVDVGIKNLATLSDGSVIPNPRHLLTSLKKIKRFSRSVTRKQKGSKNKGKAWRRLGRLYRKVSNQRINTLHQATTTLAKTKSVIVIEDLNVAGMLKNHSLAQAIVDAGFYEFRRQLLYKADWYGSKVILASRWKPSSKTCSTPGCGWVDEHLTLKHRLFHCESCGLIMDRDLNAAINLERLAGSSSDTQNACGEASAGSSHKTIAKLASMKQEPDVLEASA